MSDTRATVLAILAQISGMAPEHVRPDMDLAADLGIDSPKALTLLVDLEEALDTEISDEDAARMETVADVLAFVEQV